MVKRGEGTPQPRLGPTRRLVELLGDPQRSYPIIHITGTNGKTSTSRIIESILRAYGLRTGLFTSPHLVKLNERIVIDGEPISDEKLLENWTDIEPYIGLVDAELEKADEPALTYFEVLTALGFASFADAPVDVAVIEVGMGGEWDSTNVGDGQVAVFTPIALDHTKRLGNTIAEIARTKSGIIKPLSIVVTAAQSTEGLAELARAAELTESTFVVEGSDFSVHTTVAVGGQVLTVRGRAGEYTDLFLPMFGDYQAHNAALAIAAVESFLGDGAQKLDTDVLAEGIATASSPGRLQVVGTHPSIVVDAAHNPHGARAVASAIKSYFTFDHLTVVLAVLDDKDAEGIIRALDPIADEFIVTTAPSERTLDVDELAAIAVAIVGSDRVIVEPNLEDALTAARNEAENTTDGAVLVTGSITLIAEATSYAASEGWKQ